MAGLSYVQIPMTTHILSTPAQLAQFLGIVNDLENGVSAEKSKSGG